MKKMEINMILEDICCILTVNLMVKWKHCCNVKLDKFQGGGKVDPIAFVLT